MAVSSVSQQATTALKQITAAKGHLSTAKVTIKSYKVLQALGKKMVALAKKDGAKAAGLVDLIEKLQKKGRFVLDFNTGPLSYGARNALSSMLNDVKHVLNSNESPADDRPISPLAR